jgi:hypothetical protein
MINNIIFKCFEELDSLYIQSFGKPYNKEFPFQKQEHEWLNYYYKSEIFRHIHLEFYKTDKMCVLHSNIFPHPLLDMPILGFDMIAIGHKITGIFFDFTPTVTTSSALQHSLENLKKRYKSKQRDLPEWANFFSDNFYCVTPDESEVPLLLEDIIRYTGHYLHMGETKKKEYDLNMRTQNNYCLGQQKNDKTLKALAVEVGKDNAKLFMEKYLFPIFEK